MFICEKDLSVNPTKNAPEQLSYADFSNDACWTKTCVSNKGYYQVPGVKVSPWSIYVRGFTILTVFEDLLHNVYLGIARDFAASILIELCPAYDPYMSTMDDTLRLIYADFCSWCKGNGLKQARRRFTLKLLGKDRESERVYPSIGTQVKAASMKTILAFLNYKLTNIAANTEYERIRATTAWALCDFLHICDLSDMWMTSDQADRACHAGFVFLRGYAWLADSNMRSNITLYKIRPKHHYFHHQVLEVQKSKLNPSWLHCFVSEDFVGRSARVASRCHRKTVSLRAIQRYMLCIRRQWLHKDSASD